jgi:WD40 repeat protein/transcriptional regulator with XRE-family HTH domain
MPVSSVSLALERFTTFGDLLRYIRRSAGLTQRELSIAVGYSESQISRLEHNERLPDLATISARFIPALMLEDKPDLAERLLELAASVRREDAPASGLPPYKGLYFFDESDSELFFGRENLISSLVERLMSGVREDQRFLAIVGASGSGKSSVVRAGLIPALRWRKPSSGWDVSVMTPTAHPLEALAVTLNQQALSVEPAGEMVEKFTSHAQGLEQVLRRDAETTGVVHNLLVVDQFEELFTLCRREAEQSAYVDNLITAALHPGGVAIVIIVMRADFYAHCARFDLLREVLSQHQVFIGQMTEADLRRAIEEPARAGHWELEQGLTELLLHDVGADEGHSPEPGALPLLSHALLETWRRRQGRKLTLSGYTASGGVWGAITETAEAVFYDQLDPEQREIARQIFLRLTELGGDAAAADTRRRVNFDELSFTSEDRQTVQSVLKILADARLVTIEQDTAEVAHEALIRAWPTLRNWLEEDREGLRLHRYLTEAAREWDLSDRDPSGLFWGAKLAQASEWAENHPDDMNILERAFLEASQTFAAQETAEREAQRQRELQAAQRLAETERARAEEKSQANQRLRRRAIFLVIAFLLAGTLAIAAIVFGQRSISAERLSVSRELAAAAINNLSVDPERSVLLALQALSIADTLEARNSLRQALPELHILRTIPAHDQAPGVAYSPDGKRLASIGTNSTAIIWDVASGEKLLTVSIDQGEPGLSVAFSPDGKLLATVWERRLVVWDSATGKNILTQTGDFAGQKTINRVAFSPDGKYLAVANMDGAPVVWDLSARTEALFLAGNQSMCDGIVYSPDGSRLATGDVSGEVRIWDAATGREILSFGQGGVIHGIAYSPDGERLATANEDGTLTIWAVAGGEALVNLPRMSGLYDVAFLPDNRRVVTAHQDGTARIWDASTGEHLLTLAGHVSTVVTVVSSPDGKQIATGGYDGSVRIWDPSPGKELMTEVAHTDQAYEVRYSQDGSWLVTAGMDGMVKVWDPVSGELTLSVASGSPLTSLALSPGGERLAVGGVDGMVYLLDSRSGQIELTLKAHQAMVAGVAFSPDGKRLATTSWDSLAKVWDLSSGSEVTTFSGHPNGLLFGVAFSPDGQRVYSGGEYYGRVWDATTGQELQTFYAQGREVYGLALSPSGKYLALGLQDGDVLVWETGEGRLVKQFSGHAGLTLRVVFNLDETRLASGSFDGTAKLWDLQSGQELFTFYGNASNVFGVALSPDGFHLATTGGDGTLRIFTLKMEDLVALAQSRITRTLSEAECQKYLHRNCP